MPPVIRHLAAPTAAAQQIASGWLAALQAGQPPDSLLAKLAAASSESLAALAQQLLAQGQAPLASHYLDAILPQRRPDHDAAYLWALAHWQQGHAVQAQAIVEQLGPWFPDSYPVTLLHAEVLRAEGRLSAAAGCIRQLASHTALDVESGLGLLRFLSDSRRSQDALALSQQLLAAGPQARISAIAAQQALELGQFDLARDHALAAIEAGIDLNSHYMPRILAMCQHYRESSHPDVGLFKRSLPRLTSTGARASLHFAWGKAEDDLGHYQQAAEHFRAGNELARDSGADPAAAWLAFEQGVARQADFAPVSAPAGAPMPVFIVGMPRSGTSLLASRLAQHPEVRDRGELPTIGFIERQLRASGRLGEPQAMAEAAQLYRRHLLQDEPRVRWYLDKDPMNFGHLGLIRTLLPDARIIWCRRRERETALSIWMQHFAPGSLDYAYDFQQIRAVMSSCQRMMTRWQSVLPARALIEMHYEQLVAAPGQVLAQIYRHLGMPGQPQASAEVHGAVGTSSAWQVRQPIHGNSLQKSRHYLPWIEELGWFDSEA